MDFPDKIRALPSFGPTFDVFTLQAAGKVLFGVYKAGADLKSHSPDADRMLLVFPRRRGRSTFGSI